MQWMMSFRDDKADAPQLTAAAITHTGVGQHPTIGYGGAWAGLWNCSPPPYARQRISRHIMMVVEGKTFFFFQVLVTSFCHSVLGATEGRKLALPGAGAHNLHLLWERPLGFF